jgi:hypothetical protein
MVGHGVGARVPRPQEHRQRFLGVGAPGREWVEAPRLLEGDRRAGLVRGGQDDRGVDVDHDAARELPARHCQPGETAGLQVERSPCVRADPGAAFAIRCWAASSSAAGVRCVGEAEAGAPSRAVRWSCGWSACARFFAPPTIVLAGPGSTSVRSRRVALPPPGHNRPRAAVGPVRSARWCSSTTPACPVSPLPSAATGGRRSHLLRSLTEKVHLFLQPIRRRYSHRCSSGHLFLTEHEIGPLGLNTRG